MQPLRTVIHEQEFSSQLEAIEADFWRAEEFLEGLEWILARDPSKGVFLISEPPIRAFYTNLGKGLKRAIVYYTYSDEEVYLLSITEAVAEEAP